MRYSRNKCVAHSARLVDSRKGLYRPSGEGILFLSLGGSGNGTIGFSGEKKAWLLCFSKLCMRYMLEILII